MFNQAISSYVEKINEKYNIPKEELTNLWDEIATEMDTVKLPIDTTPNKKTKVSSPKKGKVTGYTVFAKEKRAELGKQGVSFSEASKIIGTEWSSLSDEKKKTYKELASNINKSKNTPSSIIIDQPLINEEHPIIETISEQTDDDLSSVDIEIDNTLQNLIKTENIQDPATSSTDFEIVNKLVNEDIANNSSTCKYKFIKGKNTGKYCEKKSKYDGYCYLHSNKK